MSECKDRETVFPKPPSQRDRPWLPRADCHPSSSPAAPSPLPPPLPSFLSSTFHLLALFHPPAGPQCDDRSAAESVLQGFRRSSLPNVLNHPVHQAVCFPPELLSQAPPGAGSWLPPSLPSSLSHPTSKPALGLQNLPQTASSLHPRSPSHWRPSLQSTLSLLSAAGILFGRCRFDLIGPLIKTFLPSQKEAQVPYRLCKDLCGFPPTTPHPSLPPLDLVHSWFCLTAEPLPMLFPFQGYPDSYLFLGLNGSCSRKPSSTHGSVNTSLAPGIYNPFTFLGLAVGIVGAGTPHLLPLSEAADLSGAWCIKGVQVTIMT